MQLPCSYISTPGKSISIKLYKEQFRITDPTPPWDTQYSILYSTTTGIRFYTTDPSKLTQLTTHLAASIADLYMPIGIWLNSAMQKPYQIAHNVVSNTN